jgi:hypothetical protein
VPSTAITTRTTTRSVAEARGAPQPAGSRRARSQEYFGEAIELVEKVQYAGASASKEGLEATGWEAMKPAEPA